MIGGVFVLDRGRPALVFHPTDVIRRFIFMATVDERIAERRKTVCSYLVQLRSVLHGALQPTVLFTAHAKGRRE